MLHFAALDNTSDVVKYLVDQYPTMVTTQTRDRDDYLPIHTACHFGAPLENIKVLVEADPTTLWVKNGHDQAPKDLVTN